MAEEVEVESPDDTDKKSESTVTMVDTDVIMEELGEWMNKPVTRSRFEKVVWNSLHIIMGFATRGAWLFILVAYYVYSFHQHLQRKEVDYTKEMKETEEEE